MSKILILAIALFSLNFSVFASCKVDATDAWIFEDEPSVYSKDQLNNAKDVFKEKGYNLAKSNRDADFLFDIFSFVDTKPFGCVLGEKVIFTVRVNLTEQRTRKSFYRELVYKKCLFSTGSEYKEERREFKTESILNAISKIPHCSDF